LKQVDLGISQAQEEQLMRKYNTLQSPLNGGPQDNTKFIPESQVLYSDQE